MVPLWRCYFSDNTESNVMTINEWMGKDMEGKGNDQSKTGLLSRYLFRATETAT